MSRRKLKPAIAVRNVSFVAYAGVQQVSIRLLFAREQLYWIYRPLLVEGIALPLVFLDIDLWILQA